MKNKTEMNERCELSDDALDNVVGGKITATLITDCSDKVSAATAATVEANGGTVDRSSCSSYKHCHYDCVRNHA